MTATYDVVLLGAGGAGHTLLLALASADLPLRVAVVDPVVHHGNDRTWCWWGPSAGLVAPAVDATWRHVGLAGGGAPIENLDLDPLRYRLIRSSALYDLVGERTANARRLGVERIVATADTVTAETGGVRIEAGSHSLHGSWVFDSRPTAPAKPGHVLWHQQFLGWVLPATAVPELGVLPLLMDFRTRQPARGLSFGYCLPMRDGTVLVEYTEFSPDAMKADAAEAALVHYVELLGGSGPFVPTHVETGSIPMTDAHFPRHNGPRSFRLGTAGGATRGSTGYTFAAMLRQAETVAQALADNRYPLPPRAYPARHRWMDAVMLRALDDGELDGPSFFRQLFRRQPAERVLRFLDGATNRREEVAIMGASPMVTMIRAAARTTVPHPFG